jgi:putative aldouronate transport system substrate-binding protein
MKAKKSLALLLFCAMVTSVFASCGDSTTTSTTSTDSSTTASSAESSKESSASAESSETTETTEAVVNGEVNQQTYPIADGITLDFWYPQAGSMAELADYNDSEFFKWYEEKTGIHINFIVPASGTESDSFQLLFASDDMPDMVYSNPNSTGQSYRGGEDKAIQDGYFVDLSQYFDWAPNYVSWLDNNDEWRQAAYSDSGMMYGMCGLCINTETDCTYADQGMSIRQDYLDAVGLDVPTTYSEWETVLTAFKDQLGITAPLYTSKYGIDVYGDFMAGYDTAPYFYQRDGVVQYGPLDDQYKEYLELLHDWYQKGLLDPDFSTRSSSGITADNDMILNDQVGALTDYGTRLDDTYISRGATNPDLCYVAAPQPTKDLDDPTYVEPAYRLNNFENMLAGFFVSFSADSDYLEEAIRWCDGFYAVDVALNANYGTEEYEGTVWHYDDSTSTGRLADYDYRYSNPDGMSSGMVLVKFGMKNPPIRYMGMQIENATEIKQAGYKVWETYEPVNAIPYRITQTADEGTELSSLYTDIETYVQECNVKFIMGQMSLDDYDSYRDTLRSMGIERCIELKQAAVDRYYQRNF